MKTQIRTAAKHLPESLVADDTAIPTDTADGFADPSLSRSLQDLRTREQAERDRRAELLRLREVARFD